MTVVISDRSEQEMISLLSVPLSLQYWADTDVVPAVETVEVAVQTDPGEELKNTEDAEHGHDGDTGDDKSILQLLDSIIL